MKSPASGTARAPSAESAAPEGAALPCLFSNNSNEVPSDDASGAADWERLKRCYQPILDRAAERRAEALNTLSPQQRKSAVALGWNVQAMCQRFGIERLGFLTLTFSEHVTDAKESQRRYNSLRSGVLRERYPATIRVLERQKSGRIHYHLLVLLPSDVRSGFDFDAIKRRDYGSACTDLKHEWSFWRKTAKKYGFGRVELLPIRSTEEAIARYVGKYISKHISQREEQDRGLRLVEYSGFGRVANTRFSWATNGGKEWRRKVALFAGIVGEANGYPGKMPYANMKLLLGATWAFKNREFILALP